MAKTPRSADGQDPHAPTYRVDRREPPRDGGRSLLVLAESGTTWHALPETGSVTLGRGEQCDVRIADASVSRTHARLDVGPAGVRISDLGSANGVLVRGRRLAEGELAEIAAGEVAEVGTVPVVVQTGPVRPGRDGWVAPAAAGPAVLVPAAPARAREEGIVAEDPATKRVLELVARIAPSAITVLLTGETGVGKEVVAAAIHAASGRSGRFVKINCAALATSLVESELFGYERGAFTGAQQAKEGLIEAADGGTLLLDEVGEMSLELQAKLLRVLEDREVTRVGGRDPRKIDVRFVAATNRDLRAASAAGTFRRDLYYRLNGVSIAIPPLRDRPADVRAIARRYAAAAGASIGDEALRVLCRYDWPGNVRELRNAIERAALLAGSARIEPDHLPEEISAGPAAPAPASARVPTPVLAGEDEDERARILAALEECAGNQTRAAKLLGISRRTLVTRLAQYDVPRPRKKE